MKLPNPDNTVVERDKLVSYLLNAAHPDNGGKARFFQGLGFQRDRWETLATALRKLAREAAVMQSLESPHGQKYVIVGEIESPSGRVAMVQTIWIVERGADMPRLVTAYPYEE
ncbi:MAG: hypothetical protein HOP18_26850 [Deltaproteobacteria bacterium]|nr:hypothetical protein [Deltaproteobacteria bacterium]